MSSWSLPSSTTSASTAPVSLHLGKRRGGRAGADGSALVYTLVMGLVLLWGGGAGGGAGGGVQCEVLLWGPPRLELVAPGALHTLDDQLLLVLLDLVQPAAVVTFMLATKHHDAAHHSPPIATRQHTQLRRLVAEAGGASAYLPLHDDAIHWQRFQPHPIIVKLNGSDAEEDTAMSVTYQQLEEEYGKGRVLAILVHDSTPRSHHLRRRDAAFDTTTSALSTTSPSASDDTDMTGPALYYVANKAILYTSQHPVLRIQDNDTGEVVELVLKKASLKTVDTRGTTLRFIITFSLEEGSSKVVVRFRFATTAPGYWALSEVELQDQSHRDWTLQVDAGMEMRAQRGFSYHCSGSTVFRNVSGGLALVLTDVQVQPAPITNSEQFDDAYDCVNFTTIPIWSGLLITAIMVVALAIALAAIADIRTMDRFDDPKGKPLMIFVVD